MTIPSRVDYGRDNLKQIQVKLPPWVFDCMLAAHNIPHQPVLIKEGIHPIQLFATGSQVRIHALKGERELCKRLESMGIQSGKTITILKNQTHSILLKTGNTRIAFRLCNAVILYGEQIASGH